MKEVDLLKQQLKEKMDQGKIKEISEDLEVLQNFINEISEELGICLKQNNITEQIFDKTDYLLKNTEIIENIQKLLEKFKIENLPYIEGIKNIGGNYLIDEIALFRIDGNASIPVYFISGFMGRNEKIEENIKEKLQEDMKPFIEEDESGIFLPNLMTIKEISFGGAGTEEIFDLILKIKENYIIGFNNTSEEVNTITEKTSLTSPKLQKLIIKLSQNVNII